MRNRQFVHYYETSKIYRSYYKPSFNLIRLIKSLFAAFIYTPSDRIIVHHRRK